MVDELLSSYFKLEKLSFESEIDTFLKYVERFKKSYNIYYANIKR